MTIILGSLSEDKLHTLEMALEAKRINSQIKQVAVDSCVSDQPLSRPETVQGATNRALSAYRVVSADLAIGLEGGLEMISGIYHLVCVCALFDGRYITLGYSDSLPLPKRISDCITQGSQFGVVIREYQKTASREERELVDELVSRTASFMSAIRHCLTSYQSK